MSGFVVALGKPSRRNIDSMFATIEHRGPHFSGVYEGQSIIMAQNYLKADLSQSKIPKQIPLSSNGKLRICYDGQMGNRGELGNTFRNGKKNLTEEQILLKLYEQKGVKMLSHLQDSIFAFVISNGKDLFAARDLLGIKSLFYGWNQETIYLSSELKSLVATTDDVYEFPPGHYMNGQGELIRFTDLPSEIPEQSQMEPDKLIIDIRDIIQRSVENRVDFNCQTGGLLSGGMDSSVVCTLANDLLKRKHGTNNRLATFAIGVGESPDIQNARVVAEYIDSNHHELVVTIKDALKSLSAVIYYLESFDPSLVRSALSNYMISKYAKEKGIEILLSGEGGDEIFCGYTYLKKFPEDELFNRQMECMRYLHNNASLRLDRMNQANSIKVVAPLISGELLRYVMGVPAEYKLRDVNGEKIEKWIFRRAFESYLPKSIVWRTKQEFSQGSGTAGILPTYFDGWISNDELQKAQEEHPFIRSKEELYYFRIFVEHFGTGRAVETVGQWISL